MKARKVKRLDPDDTLFANARRIIRVRTDELYSFDRAARDEDAVEELHDMRIAAKRLRYVLEISEPAFGAPARGAAARARELQDLLGGIHDCDVMLPRVEAHMNELRTADAAAVARAVPDDVEDLSPRAAKEAPNRARYRGLEALATHLRARRKVLYRRFVTLWGKFESEDFRRRLERDLARPARPTVAAPQAGDARTPASRATQRDTMKRVASRS